MVLHYNESCPEDYNPPGFESCQNSNKLAFKHTDERKIQPVTIRGLSTSSHAYVHKFYQLSSSL